MRACSWSIFLPVKEGSDQFLFPNTRSYRHYITDVLKVPIVSNVMVVFNAEGKLVNVDEHGTPVGQSKQSYASHSSILALLDFKG
jgi:hypothetical protein